MTWGKELSINLKKINVGNPRLTINSISWTLLAKEKTEMIKIRINNELLASCLKIYLSTKFIDF